MKENIFVSFYCEYKENTKDNAEITNVDFEKNVKSEHLSIITIIYNMTQVKVFTKLFKIIMKESISNI